MIDNVKPKGAWEFNAEVTQCFPNMLERSIPGYKEMRYLVSRFAERAIGVGGTIVDIGCSTGLAVEPLYLKYFNKCKYLLIDVSKPMTEECKNRYADGIECGFVKVENAKIWNIPLPENTTVVLSVLSLQFMPTAYRQEIIKRIYDSLHDGGVFILVEKVIADNNFDNEFVDEYYRMKRQNGYTEQAIRQKRESLENVLSPLKASWNEDMLKTAGFKKVDMFWRHLNFCGWAAVK